MRFLNEIYKGKNKKRVFFLFPFFLIESLQGDCNLDPCQGFSKKGNTIFIFISFVTRYFFPILLLITKKKEEVYSNPLNT